jgi:translation initiation factor IF-2
MTDTTQTIRLSKAAKEFNVGITTIIEFLAKKGHKIDSNPNTKISEEIYAILVKEFQSEKMVKEESKKLDIGGVKKEINAVPEFKTTTKEVEKEELIIKTTVPQIKNEEIVEKKEKSSIKVVSKIGAEEIEKVSLKTKTPKTKLAKAETEVEKEAISDKAKKTVATKSKKTKTKEEVKEQLDLFEEKSVKKETAKDTKEKEEKMSNVSKVHLEVKVTGKIDLDSLNVKTKPAKKTKEEKESERIAKKEIKKPKTASKKKSEKEEEVVSEEVTAVEKEIIVKDEIITETEQKKKEVKAIEPDENFHKTEFIKLDGPTILGKMDLPVVKEFTKKPVASSDDEMKSSKKKKRKRIHKDIRPTETTGTQQSSNLVVQKKQLGKGKVTGRKDFVKTEVDDDEIQRQIKETLARLSGTGKSKTSKHRRLKREIANQQLQEEMEKTELEKSTIKVAEFVTAFELANMMNVSVNDIISTCLNLGIFVSINQRLDAETIVIVADEFGYKVEFITVDAQDLIVEEKDKEEDLKHRSPIVTIMGHVDHGKTSLLDYIRKTNVIAGEAGGITQHIGAYEVQLDNKKRITFLDTPGHEAFTAMRARGAKVTDIVIIVVAADDSVMPQTIEAINHAQAANVPIIIAINKIDKPGVNIDKIREELSKINILVEDWGGKYQCQEISAKKGINIELLLEKVLLEAEMLELKANPGRKAMGTVIESSLDKGRGYISKLLVQNGTMKIGDVVIAGSYYGRAKAMYNERNLKISEAGPSAPVLLLGLNGAPQAGDTFNVMSDEHEAKNIANKRLQLQREQGIRTQKHITLDEIGRRIAIGDFKELNIIVKGDVDGSVEALSDSLMKLSSPEVQVNVIHKSVGQVTESDVLLASASNAIIVGFQVRPSVQARKLAEAEQIDIRNYSIIYNAINEIKSAIEGMLSPEIEEKIVCNVEIREVFKITKVGTIAGCVVLDGKITRNTKIRVIRDGIVVYTGNLASLKRFKDDVKEVVVGQDCGLNIENFNDIKVGDIVEGYEQTEIKRKL